MCIRQMLQADRFIDFSCCDVVNRAIVSNTLRAHVNCLKLQVDETDEIFTLSFC